MNGNTFSRVSEKSGKDAPRAQWKRIVWPTVAMASVALLAACSGAPSEAGMPAPSDSGAGTTETSAETLPMNQALHDQLPEAIQKAGTIKVGIDPTYAPMEFTDDNNAIVGSDPELIEAMGQVLGVKIEYVVTKFAAIIPSLNSDRFDIGMNMGDYLKREAEADFLDFFLAKRAFLIPADAKDLNTVTDMCGLTIGMLQGTDSLDKVDEANILCAEKGLKPINAQAFPTNNEVVLALDNGRIDASFSDTPSAGYAALKSDGKFKTTGTDMYGLPPYYGMLVKKESPLLTPLEGALNAVIDSGHYEEIFTKWGLQDGLIPEAVINGAKE